MASAPSCKNDPASDISPEDEKWIRAYEGAVLSNFEKEFGAAKNRFKSGEQLLSKFKESVNLLMKEGRQSITKVDAVHNELCIAARLLANSKPEGFYFAALDYEPEVTESGKSIDFRATSDNGEIVYIDVKTLQPNRTDRWDQFEKVQKDKLLPDNVNVVLSQGWMGGELWHGMYAARASMLTYTLELEEKIRDGKLAASKTVFVLALCGEGFHWHQDGLEDFVAFYKTEKHRGDDAFAKMEDHFIATKKIQLDKTIHRFCCMNRPQFDIHPRRLTWDVQPPTFSKF